MVSLNPAHQQFELEPDELVDDRALERADGDRFRHLDVITELAQLVTATEMPANIALFAPWGSGKSGIANVLPAHLPDKKREIRFVKFDAFKYAEAPLRRQFLSQVAASLGLKGSKYGDELYITTESRRVRFPRQELLKLAGAFLVAVLLTFAVLLLIATAVAALSQGPFKDAWSGIVGDYLLATVPVAAAITTFVKLAADGFHIKTTRGAPTSDEEFEDKFRELVADAKTQRLVIFIDELDRCSPDQVASTLETIKTFLEVEGCVFIVAADQQVLEQALRERVRQSTPEDTTNPYYSAGSSYLDKVFQYQLSLPPLKASTLTSFAYDLVRERAGVWQRVPQLDEVISVLIPTHVSSPRRVKVLLNRFAMTYRLAERRAEAGLLSEKFPERAAELAKLVCLQSEFPLFADTLSLDARMPSVVLVLADGEPVPLGTRPEVEQRARAFAEGRASVTELLVRTPAVVPPDEEQVGALGDQAKPVGSQVDGKDGGSPDVQNRGAAVVHEQAQQLVRYLRKAAHVEGPGADLLYLQSAGADTDLDPAEAEGLARAAIDGDTAVVLELVAALEDANRKRDALRVLSDVVREEHVGVEGRNVVSVLLQSIERSDVALDDVADRIADAVAGHLSKYRLAPEDLRGALALSRASSRAVGEVLKGAVLDHEQTYERAAIAVEVLAVAPTVLAERGAQVARATTVAILQEPEAAASQLKALSDADTQRLLQNAREALVAPAEAHFAAGDEEADASARLDMPPDDALGRLFDACVGGPTALKEAVASLMLDVDHQDMRLAVERRLDHLAPVQDAGLTRRLLRSTSRRPVPDWGTWLAAVDPAAVNALDDDAGSLVGALALRLWTVLRGDDPPSDEQAATASVALKRLTDAGVPVERDSVQRALAAALEEPADTNGAVAARNAALTLAGRFVEMGVLDAQSVADASLSSCVVMMKAAALTTPAAGRSEVPGALVKWTEAAAVGASREPLERAVEAAHGSNRLDSYQQARVRLTAAAAIRMDDASYTSPESPDSLRELVAGMEEDSDGRAALTTWLGAFDPQPREVWHVLEPLAGDALPAGIADALRGYSERLDAGERFELADEALNRSLTEPVDASFLTAALFSEVDSRRVVPRLLELWSSAKDDDERRTVLNLWRAYSPSGEVSRRRLVESIYLPLAVSGPAGFNLAIEFFGLVSTPPSGTKKRIREALKSAATNEERRRRLEARLLEAKWSERGLRTLGRVRDKKD